MEEQYYEQIRLPYKDWPEYCPICGCEWSQVIERSERTVQGLKCMLNYRLRYRICQNHEYKHVLHEIDPIAPKGKHYTFKVICEAIYWVIIKRRSYKEAAEEMQENHKLLIDPSTVSRWVEEFTYIFANCYNEDLRDFIYLQDGVIISFDGLKPKKGAKAIWIAMDAISGMILNIQIMEREAEENFAEFIKQTLDKHSLDVSKVKAFVSDSQTGFYNAIARHYPQVDHQICNFHFTNNAEKAIREADRAMKKQLKKKLGQLSRAGINQRNTEELDKEDERMLCNKMFEGLLMVANRPGRYPDNFRGMELIEEIEGEISRARIVDFISYPGFEKVVNKVEKILKKCLRTYEDFKLGREFIGEFKKLLYADDINEENSEPIMELFRKIGKNSRFQRVYFLKEALTWTKTRYLKYENNLYVWKRVEGCPRTNNRMETTIGMAKRRMRAHIPGHEPGYQMLAKQAFTFYWPGVTTKAQILNVIQLYWEDFKPSEFAKYRAKADKYRRKRFRVEKWRKESAERYRKYANPYYL